MRGRSIVPVLLALAGLTLIPPRAAHASETRHYQVVFRGRVIGTSLLSVRTDPGGLTTYVHESHLKTTRNGETRWSTLHEEVRLRDGVFESAWAVKEDAGVRHVIRARWDPGAGVVWVSKDGNETAVPAGSPAGLETLFDAPRRLVLSGQVGARRRVFDMPEAKVGWVVLVAPRNKDGWARTDELGIHVRTRWAEGAKLPDVLELSDLGLVYTTTSIATGAGAAAPEDLTGGGVKIVGRIHPGATVRLLPASAWPGLACPGHPVPLTASGPICPIRAADGDTSGPRYAPGPRVRALVRDLPKTGSVIARAKALARRVHDRLEGRPGGAALWQADPETALAEGAGDCNEAAAVFMAAAPLVHLTARRRTGLVVDPTRPTEMWPHAWVEVRDHGKWVRVDPSRGQAPATGIYLDLGNGARIDARVRAIAPTLHGATVKVVH